MQYIHLKVNNNKKCRLVYKFIIIVKSINYNDKNLKSSIPRSSYPSHILSVNPPLNPSIHLQPTKVIHWRNNSSTYIEHIHHSFRTTSIHPPIHPVVGERQMKVWTGSRKLSATPGSTISRRNASKGRSNCEIDSQRQRDVWNDKTREAKEVQDLENEGVGDGESGARTGEGREPSMMQRSKRECHCCGSANLPPH